MRVPQPIADRQPAHRQSTPSVNTVSHALQREKNRRQDKQTKPKCTAARMTTCEDIRQPPRAT